MQSARLVPARIIRHTLAYCLVLSGLAISFTPLVRAQERPSASDNPFADDAWHLELGAHYAPETWNYNISHENMIAGTVGVSYGVSNSLALVISAPLYYVQQRGPDAWLLGSTWGVRWRAFGRRRVAMFVEVEVGISRASQRTPPEGTRFNYLALGAAGITTRVADGIHLLTSIQWVHVSNNGLAGRRRNPDIEAVGPRISVLMRF